MRKLAMAMASLMSVLAMAQNKITHVVLMRTTGNDTISIEKFDSISFSGPCITVDMGTGFLWSKYNVGATSEDEEGDKYAWGMTETKDKYSWDTYMCRENEAGSYKDPMKGLKNIAGTEFDVATQKMGKDWKMPTIDQYSYLANSCTWTVEKRNGHIGMLATSKTTGNTLFFPCTPSADGKSFHGYYWSSSNVAERGDYARRFDLDNGSVSTIKSWCRYTGFSVKAVTNTPNNFESVSIKAGKDTYSSTIPNLLCIKFITEESTAGFSLSNYLIDVENGEAFEISAKDENGTIIPVSELDWHIDNEGYFDAEESENSIILKGKVPHTLATFVVVKYNGMTLVSRVSVKRNVELLFSKDAYSVKYGDSLKIPAFDDFGQPVPASELTFPESDVFTFQADGDSIIVKSKSKEEKSEALTFTYKGATSTLTLYSYSSGPAIKLSQTTAELTCDEYVELTAFNEKKDTIDVNDIEWTYDESILSLVVKDGVAKFTLSNDANTTTKIVAKYNGLESECSVKVNCLRPALHVSQDTVNIACDSFFVLTVTDETGKKLTPNDVECSYWSNYEMEYTDSCFKFTVVKPTIGKTYVGFRKDKLYKQVVANMTCNMPYDLTLSDSVKSITSETFFFLSGKDQYGLSIPASELEIAVYPNDAMSIVQFSSGFDLISKIKADTTIIVTMRYHDVAKQCTVKVKKVNHTYVDMGLPSGTMWATCNLGARSSDEYGGSFAWGDLYDGYSYIYSKMSNNDMGSEKDPLRNYVYPKNRNGILPAEYDAATQWIGENWKIPTNDDVKELMSNSTLKVTKVDGVNGTLVTSKINGNSIFFPAAGYYHGSTHLYEGSSGIYHTSNCDSNCAFYSSYFSLEGSYKIGTLYREEYKSIRPVFKKDPLNLSVGDQKIACDGSFELSAVDQYEKAISVKNLKVTFSKPGVLSCDTINDSTLVFKSLVNDNFKTTVTVANGKNTKSFNVEVICRSESADGKVNGYKYIDMGLPSGTKWAECNIGAKDRTEAGEFFAYGETESKDAYVWGTYMDGFSGAKDCFTENDWLYKYQDCKSLPLGMDAANANMGGSWYTPSLDEWNELIKYCTGSSTTINGVGGILMTSTINGNTLFFPVSGLAQGTDIFYGHRAYCMVAQASGKEEYYMFCRNAVTEKIDCTSTTARYFGSPVRGVTR